MRDATTFKADLQQARDNLEKFFDARQESVHGAMDELDALLAQPMQETLPTLDNTLAALRQAQVRLENAPRPAATSLEQR